MQNWKGTLYPIEKRKICRGLIEIASNNSVCVEYIIIITKKNSYKTFKMMFMREWVLVVKIKCIQYM